MEKILYKDEVQEFNFEVPSIAGGVSVKISWDGCSTDPHDPCFSKAYIMGSLGCAPFVKKPEFAGEHITCNAADRSDVLQALHQYLDKYGVEKSQYISETHTITVLVEALEPSDFNGYCEVWHGFFPRGRKNSYCHVISKNWFGAASELVVLDIQHRDSVMLSAKRFALKRFESSKKYYQQFINYEEVNNG